MNERIIGSVTTLLVLGALLPANVHSQVRIRTVDLFGVPIAGMDVRIEDTDAKVSGKPDWLFPVGANATDENGVATIYVEPNQRNGRASIRVNMDEGLKLSRNLNRGFIGRIKRVNWSTEAEFRDGFAVPLWTPGDVKSLADTVIRNPTHYAIAVQLGARNGAGSRIIAEVDRDVDWWIDSVAGDLPTIVHPELARALFNQVDAGEVIPARFDDAMRDVFNQVERQREAARACLRPPAPGPPPNQPFAGPTERPWPSFPSQPAGPLIPIPPSMTPPFQPLPLTPFGPPSLPRQPDGYPNSTASGCCLLRWLHPSPRLTPGTLETPLQQVPHGQQWYDRPPSTSRRILY